MDPCESRYSPPILHGGTTQRHYQGDERQVHHGRICSRVTRLRCRSYQLEQNDSLSDSSDEILRLQGVPWFTRRAISMFTLTLRVKHTTDAVGVEHIDIDQTLSGGIPGTSENRPLDWQERTDHDHVFGYVTEKARRIPVEEVTDTFLKEDWTQDTIDDHVVIVDSWSTPDKNNCTWRAVQVIVLYALVVLFSSCNQTWGFAMVNGERRHVRLLTFTSPQKRDGPIYARFVYDYGVCYAPLVSMHSDPHVAGPN